MNSTIDPSTIKREPVRISYLTAGAAGMYCGSCMHDNALAKALTREGYDTLLIPTYTPIRTDEKEVTIDQVFFGGINIFLQQKVPLLRFVPRMMDRFLDNPKLIRKVTSRVMETDSKMLGSLTVSMLKGREGNQKKEVRRLVDWLTHDARPDVIILSNILIAGFVKELKKRLNIPVIVTLQGDDIFLQSLQEPHQSQAIELICKLDKYIDGYIVHSNYYADMMAKYCNLNRQKMFITPLGIDTDDFQGVLRNRKASPVFNIGYLARLSEDKGLHHLVSAFIKLKERDEMQHVKLKVAGWLGKDHETFVAEQFARLDQAGLENDYEHLGVIDRAEKIRLLNVLDLMCVPTSYLEPKGLYVLEALASGIPVVQPAHGVFPEMIADLSGGILFAAGDNDELARKLGDLVFDHEKRNRLGSEGRENVMLRRNAQSMAEATIAVVKQVMADHDKK